LYGAKTRTLLKVDQKYLASFEIWFWRRMKISWTDCVRNEEVLRRVKEKRNTLNTIKGRMATWIGHILHKNCLLTHITEGKTGEGIAEMGRQRRRHKQLTLRRAKDIGNCKWSH
jgi:hypothetical protein